MKYLVYKDEIILWSQILYTINVKSDKVRVNAFFFCCLPYPCFSSLRKIVTKEAGGEERDDINFISYQWSVCSVQWKFITHAIIVSSRKYAPLFLHTTLRQTLGAGRLLEYSFRLMQTPLPPFLTYTLDNRDDWRGFLEEWQRWWMCTTGNQRCLCWY